MMLATWSVPKSVSLTLLGVQADAGVGPAGRSDPRQQVLLTREREGRVDDHLTGGHARGRGHGDRPVRVEDREVDLLGPASRSQASSRSQSAAARWLDCSSASVLIFRSEITGPPFWASPVWSRPRMCRPSSRAATAIVWATVTTPVPPMPMMRMPNSSPRTRSRGSGRSSARSGSERRPLGPLGPWHHREERRAVAGEAREVLVARGLVDLGLAAELGLHRVDRQDSWT